MEKMQIAIGRLLFVGAIFSFILVALGGGLYLWEHGSDVVNQSMFASNTIVSKPLLPVGQLSALGIVQLGLFALVLTQLLRVAMTTWYFIKLREKVFMGISAFILLVLVYSLLCKGIFLRLQ